jgi:hypothetical protein
MRRRVQGSLVCVVLFGCLSLGAAPEAKEKNDAPATDALTELCHQLGSSDTCADRLKKGPGKIGWLIATVADPVQTNLALHFDRSVEALIWAVGDVGYTFQSYWVPWSSADVRSAPSGASSSRERNEASETSGNQAAIFTQPGFLLFRGNEVDNFLVIWLVGESPTGGIASEALRTAIENIRKFDSHPELRIIGPSFSGSFTSLATELTKARTAERLSDMPDGEEKKYHVMTGMATSLTAQVDFVNRLNRSNANVEFKATIHDVSYGLNKFVAYLQHHWGQTGEIAILAEDQTAYGQALQAEISEFQRERWLLVRFPREIARLRNTYETETGKAVSSESKNSPSVLPEDLAFSLRSGRESADTVPDFSRTQGPLSQESVLLDIANALQHEHVKYAGILATDVLDEIFLVRFLHKACPDVRLILFDADLLFARAELTTPLEGVLSITTYPLFLRNQHWTEEQMRGQLPQRIPFASRASEGIYNATRAQLWFEGFCGTGELMLDYFHPDKNPSWYPPLWLTVLGRTGYWPVALLDEELSLSAPIEGKSFLLKSPITPPFSRTGISRSFSGACEERRGQTPAAAKPRERLHAETPSHGWSLVMLLVSSLSILHCLYFWLVYRPQQLDTLRDPAARGSGIRKALCYVFAVYPSGAKAIFNRSLLVIILALAAAEVVLTASGAPYSSNRTGAAVVSQLLYFVLPLFSLILLVIVAVQLSFTIRSVANLALPWILSVTFATLWLSVIGPIPFEDMRAYFFTYRILQPSSGMSPGLPVLLLVSVCFAWGFAQYLREAGEITPDVPDLIDTSRNAEKLDRWLTRLVPPVFAVYAVVFTLMLFWNRLHSVEDRSYDVLVNFLVALCYFLMFSAWSQLWIAWWYFRIFLESLERHPMRDAFSRLPKELATLPLFRKGRQKPFILTSARCLDTLIAFSQNPVTLKEQSLAKQCAGLAVWGRRHLERLLSLRRYGRGAELYLYKDINEEKTNLHQIIFASTGPLISLAQRKFWSSGKSESVEQEDGSAKRDKLGRLNDEEKCRVLAEEFIALRLVMYILHVLRHMHKLMWFVVIAFVLTIMAMNVYPFKSPRLIDFSAIAIFIVFAIGTCIVLAQMDRDSILSRLTATTPNEIGKTFFIRVASFGTLPLITVLSTQFPGVRNFLFSWVQPALQALSK